MSSESEMKTAEKSIMVVYMRQSLIHKFLTFYAHPVAILEIT